MGATGEEGKEEHVVTGIYRDDLPREWEELLWRKYEESFGALDNYQDQMCYDRESFLAALRDADYLKFVVLEKGRPRGLALAVNDLEKAAVAYINAAFLRRRYPREVEEGRFYYVTAIFIDPQSQGMGQVKSLLRAMLSFMKEGRRVAGFDFSEAKEFLAGVIENLSRDGEVGIPVRARRLDAQVYYSLELADG
jgi:ribosomal protein S18 acetylase RimI-like enzyme